MRHKLEEIFERYTELNTLYLNPSFDDPIWVIHRWLELIPVDPEQKQHFISQKDCQLVLNYLKELVID
jgi:Lon protease-like protein